MPARLASTKAALASAAFFIASVILLAVNGCATVDHFGGSRQAVVEWGKARGFDSSHVRLGRFQLLILQRVAPVVSAEVLNVYIEGDGAAWPTPFHPPSDPTPRQPTALAMAVADPAPAVAYLGRPCQYLDAAELAGCSADYWTELRFSPEVVVTYMAFLDRLKLTSGAKRLRLFGHSGGGVIATLLAGRRKDVAQLITVAAPLSVAEWTTWHGATPLRGSMDPAAAVGLELPAAVHFVGGRDSVVPARLVATFAERTGGKLREVLEFDHQCCWSRDWPKLLGEIK